MASCVVCSKRIKKGAQTCGQICLDELIRQQSEARDRRNAEVKKAMDDLNKQVEAQRPRTTSSAYEQYLRDQAAREKMKAVADLDRKMVEDMMRGGKLEYAPPPPWVTGSPMPAPYVRPGGIPNEPWQAGTSPFRTRTTGMINTSWLRDAYYRIAASDSFLKLEIEDKGVVVIGQSGEKVISHTVSWGIMEAAQINPLIPAIVTVETALENG